MASTHFDAELERVGKTSARLQVPVDLEEIFGRARRITSTVDGVRQGKHR